MPLEKGSLVFANYTAKVKDTGEPIETCWTHVGLRKRAAGPGVPSELFDYRPGTEPRL